MNILVVSQYYYPEPFRINEICEELVKRGHDITVLTTNPNYPDGYIYDGYKNISNIEVINGVNVIRCKSRPRYKGFLNLALNYISYALKASREIKNLEKRYDVIYAYQLSPIFSCFPALKYKKKYGVPLFLYCLDVWPESLKGTMLGKPPLYRLFKHISRKIYSSADQIAVTTQSFIPYISELCNISENKIIFLPQHANQICIQNDTTVDLQKYKEYTNFVFLGNVGEAQNIECIIKAASYIDKNSNIKIHIVGSGSHLEKCKQMTEKLHVDDIVIFHGRHSKEEMPKFYAMADVCLLTLKTDGIVGYTIPGKLQEYMSAGKPVLACIDGDAVKVIRDAECGLCVEEDNFEEIAEEMLKMSQDKEMLRKYAYNSSVYYVNHFTLKKHIDQLQVLLGKLLK